eukprot:gene12767-biopygen442
MHTHATHAPIPLLAAAGATEETTAAHIRQLTKLKRSRRASTFPRAATLHPQLLGPMGPRRRRQTSPGSPQGQLRGALLPVLLWLGHSDSPGRLPICSALPNGATLAVHSVVTDSAHPAVSLRKGGLGVTQHLLKGPTSDHLTDVLCQCRPPASQPAELPPEVQCRHPGRKAPLSRMIAPRRG